MAEGHGSVGIPSASRSSAPDWGGSLEGDVPGEGPERAISLPGGEIRPVAESPIRAVNPVQRSTLAVVRAKDPGSADCSVRLPEACPRGGDLHEMPPLRHANADRIRLRQPRSSALLASRGRERTRTSKVCRSSVARGSFSTACIAGDGPHAGAGRLRFAISSRCFGSPRATGDRNRTSRPRASPTSTSSWRSFSRG